MKTFHSFCILLLSVSLHAQEPCRAPLGATLGQLTWNFNPSNWFVDYMKMSAPGFGPVSGPWDPGSPATDAEGWPTEPFSVWVKLGLYPQDTGVYHLEFEGFAQVFAFDGHLITDQQYDAPTNTTTAKLQINPAAHQIALQFSAPMSTAVRRIRLIAPGFDPANAPTFHPDWVEHLGRFPVLRFMTWNAGNLNTVSHWSERNTLNSPTQGISYDFSYPNKGVAWEYVAELANLTGADIWISVPVRADDDYVTQLALLLKNELQPGAKIYIEYANEVWNPGAPPHQENRNAAIAEVNAGNSNLDFDGSVEPHEWSTRRYARRTKEIGDLFSQVFGDNSLFTRVFPVLGYQATGPGGGLKASLEFMRSQYGPPKNYYWAVAGAPFLTESEALQPGLTRDLLFQKLNQQIGRQFGNTDNYLDEGVAFATYYGLRFMAHESGISTAMNDSYPQAVRDTVAAAQNDPRMKTLIENYLANWFRYGGKDGVFNWFIAGATDWRLGDTYGLVPDVTTQDGAKMQAIDQVLSNICPEQTVGHPIPGVVDARQFTYYPENWDAQSFNPFMFEGNSHQYLLNASHSGAYCFQLVTQRALFGPARFQVLLDDTIIDTLTVPENPQPGIDTLTVGLLSMSQGLHTLRLRYLSWCYGTHALIFTADGCSVATTEVVDHNLKLYPNPAKDGFFVQANPRLDGVQWLQVTDVLNRKMLEKQVLFKENQPVWIEINLPPGLYHVRIGNSVGRLVVQ